MPSSLSMTWALYPNSTGLSMRPLRIGRASVVQADQPGRAVGHLPGQPGPGLGHHRGGPLDGDRQLAQRPPQPAPHPPAERAPDRSAAVAQHRSCLRRSSLRQLGQIPGHPGDRSATLVPAQLGPGTHRGGHLPRRRQPPAAGQSSPSRWPRPRPAPAAPPAPACPPPGPAAPHRSVDHVRGDHRGIGPHPAGAQQLGPAALTSSASFSPATAASPHRWSASSASWDAAPAHPA